MRFRYFKLVLVCALALVPIVSSAQTTTVRINPVASEATGAGNTFSVEVRIDDYVDLYGYRVEFFYNTAAVSHVSNPRIVQGTILNPAGGSLFLNTGSSTTTGRLLVDHAVLGSVSGVTGTDGLAFTVQFDGVAPGGTDWIYTDVRLRDSGNTPIPFDLESGTGAVAIATPDASGSGRYAALATSATYGALGASSVSSRVENAGSAAGMITAFRYDTEAPGGDGAPFNDPDGTITDLSVADGAYWEVTSALTGAAVNVDLAFSTAGLSGPLAPSGWRVARRALNAGPTDSWSILPKARTTVTAGMVQVNNAAGDNGAGQYALVYQGATCETSSDGVEWCMAYDNDGVYLDLAGAFNSANDAVNLYLDLDPAVPVNACLGGANGASEGPGFDRIAANLPSCADFYAFVKAGYDAYRVDDGSGSWAGGADNTISKTTGPGSTQFFVPWSATPAGVRPAAFNWLGYLSYDQGASNGAFGSIPVANPTASGNGVLDLDFVRYYTIEQTSPAQDPFARGSYTFVGATDEATFGGIDVYDFTMNSSGRSITRSAGDWTIAGDLVIGSGTIDFGSTADDADVDGSLFLQPSGALTLSSDDASALRVSGPFSLFGTFDGAATEVVLDGTAAQTMDGPSLSIPRLSVANAAGVSLLTGDLSVTNVLDLQAGTLTVPASRTLTLAATANGDGSTAGLAALMASGGAIAGDGEVVYQRYYGYAEDGWRQVGSSLVDIPMASLNASFHTQGAPWATFPNGRPVLYRWDATIQDYDYDGVGGTAPEFEPGVAYYLYLFRDNINAGNPPHLPGSWIETTDAASGGDTPEAADGVSPTLACSNPLDDMTCFNMVSNPYAAPLDFDEVVANGGTANIYPSMWAWDPSDPDGYGPFSQGDYVIYNSPSGVPGDANRLIATGQGFWVQGNASGAPSIEFEYDDKTTDAPVFYGRSAGEASPYVQLRIAGEGMGSDQTYLVFHEGATDERDEADMLRIVPISDTYATLGLFDASERTLAMDARGGETETFRVAPLVTAPGSYTLSWPTFHQIPESWTITLFDGLTGTTVDLREVESYTFDLASATAAAGVEPGGRPVPARSFSGGDAARFEIRVNGVVVANEATPEALSLGNLAPNPTSGRTQTVVELPAPSRVTVKLYDVLGREVGVMLDQELAAGRHPVAFDAARLPSGTYMVTLEALGQRLVRPMTIAR